MKKAVTFVVLAMLICLIAGGLWYRNYTRSPEYSLLKIREAIGQHDVDLFEKHVDVDGVTSSLIDQLMAQMYEEADGQGLGGALAQGLIGLMKPRLTDVLKEQILNAVETGSFEQESKGQEDSGGLDLSLTNIVETGSGTEFEGIDQITKEGKIAYVGLKLRPKDSKQGTLVLTVKMRDRGGYWQVAELTNAGEIIQELRGPEQIAANESSAISTCRNIVTSQITYAVTSGQGYYAPDLKTLMNSGLIPESLEIKSNGTGERYGYRFRVTSESRDAFTVNADPLTPGETGERHFFSDESGVIRWSSQGPATLASSPLGQ